MPMETSTMNARSRTMREHVMQMWGPLVQTSNYRCYCFAEKWSWKTRINESFQHLYPVAAWMNELPWKARVTACTWHHEVDIIILFFVLKTESEEYNVTRVLCGDMDFCLPDRTGCTKLASMLTFMVNRGERSCTSHLHARTSFWCALSC